MFADIVIHSGSWGIGDLLITAIIIIAVVAIFYAYCQWAGIQIPAIAVKCFWIVLGAAVAIFAIKLLLSM